MLGATAGSGASSLPPKHGVSAPSPPPAPARRQGHEIDPETGVHTLQGLQTAPRLCLLPWSSQRLDEAGLAIPLSSKGQTSKVSRQVMAEPGLDPRSPTSYFGLISKAGGTANPPGTQLGP